MRWPRALPLAAAALCAPLLAACGQGAAPGPDGRVTVVAAENVWGSLATELAGARGTVRSLVANPDQDPHTYAPTAGDARAMAAAQLVVFTGVGYDRWAPRLLAANPVAGRGIVDVGGVLGLREGDNPHRWYDPADVTTVARAITAELQRADPADAAYFQGRYRALQTVGLARYHALISAIGHRYAGTPVGASESIFAPMAPALGLRLVTPAGFMRAISEGTDPTPQDTDAVRGQLAGGRVAVWIENAQNATPDVQRLTAQARASHIPVVTVTESLTPAGASFGGWQSAQLLALEQALRQATGR